MAGSTDRRGEWVALLGGVLCLAAAGLMFGLAAWSSSPVVWAAGFQIAGVVGVCFLTWIHLHQLRLVAEEGLEVAALERQRQEKLGGAQTIFDEEDLDQMEQLAMGRRLRSIERVLVPVVALAVAAYNAVIGLGLTPWFGPFGPLLDAETLPTRTLVVMAVAGGLAFVFFMVSRYAIGMSRINDWGALRAAGNYLFGACTVCLAAILALVFLSRQQEPGAIPIEVWITAAIGILMVVLAVETVVNFILDFYRPRIAGAQQRPFYDSRLLGMFSEPGGILNSLANAIDYQFGFTVSQTWFYRLLGRAVLPLLLLQGLLIFALTMITIVPPGHRAVIEHLGLGDSEIWVARPGVHLTWFWPIDRATIIPVERIRRFEIGHEDDDHDADTGGKPILWTQKHFQDEHLLLVADHRGRGELKVPVNLLSVSMPVQWRVRSDDAEVIRFHRQVRDTGGLLEALAYRELTRFAAQADLLDLLGEGGVTATSVLKRNIQRACDTAGDDGAGLGVDIIHVGIDGIHPPPGEDVAKEFELVVNAFEKRDQLILEAEGLAAAYRVGAAGEGWRDFHEAVEAEDAAREANASDFDNPHSDRVEAMLDEIGGAAGAYTALADERSYRRIFREKAAAERYATQSDAFESAQHSYLLRAYLRMLEEGLADLHKYVVAVDHPERILYQVDLKPSPQLNVLGDLEMGGQSGE